MACVFREGKRPNVTYGVSFQSLRRDHRFWHRVGPDRAGAEVTRERIEELERNRPTNTAPTADVSRWLERLPAKLRENLAAADLIDAGRTTAGLSIDQHLADFGASLTAKGTTPKRIEQATGRAGLLLKAAGVKAMSEIAPATIEHGLATVTSGNGRKLTSRTKGFYLASLKQFCGWAVRCGRLASNPVAHLSVKLAGDLTKRRRPLTVEEVRSLVSHAADDGMACFSLTGGERALLYVFAAETGCRAGEVAALTAGDFDVSDKLVRVTLRARTTKNRRERSLLLSAGLSALMRDALKAKLATAAAFRAPRLDNFADMLRRDMATARQAWIGAAATPEQRSEREKTGFLASPDASGREVDFHALRVTSASLLVAGGFGVKLTQERLGHSDPQITLKVYAMTYREGEAEAMARMPDLTARPADESARATGTDDATANASEGPETAQRAAQRVRMISVHSDSSRCAAADENGRESEARKSLQDQDSRAVVHADSSRFVNATGATRTHDLRFRKPLGYLRFDGE